MLSSSNNIHERPSAGIVIRIAQASSDVRSSDRRCMASRWIWIWERRMFCRIFNRLDTIFSNEPFSQNTIGDVQIIRRFIFIGAANLCLCLVVERLRSDWWLTSSPRLAQRKHGCWRSHFENDTSQLNNAYCGTAQPFLLRLVGTFCLRRWHSVHEITSR